MITAAGLQIDYLAEDDISGIVKLITACGQGDDPVRRGHLDVRVEVRARPHRVDKGLELSGAGEGDRIDVGVSAGHKSGKHVETVVLCRRQVVQNRMLGIVSLVLIVRDGLEHRAVLHMMSVDQRILLAELRVAQIVHEDASAGVLGAVQNVVQVVLVVRPPQHRIADHRVRGVDPADHLRILGLQRGEIHRDGSRHHRRRLDRRLGLLDRGRGGGLRAHVLLVHILIGLGRLMIAEKSRVELVSREDKHSQEDPAQDNQEDPSENMSE